MLIIILCIIYCSVDKLVNEDELFKKLHDVDARVRSQLLVALVV